VGETEGVIIEALPHLLFTVELDNGKKLLGHMSGPDRHKYLRLVPGDRVAVDISPYDLTRCRITKRLL
jgi:translation initiation factor IF-1